MNASLNDFFYRVAMLISIATSAVQPCPAQIEPPSNPVQTIYARGTSAKIPFETVNNEIVITANIGGLGNLKLIVDTGVVNSVLDQGSVSGARFPRSPGSYEIHGMANEVLQAQLSPNLKMALPGMSMNGVSFLIASGDSVIMPMPVHIDGLLGYNILRNYVVKIDYLNGVIEFSDSLPADPRTAGTVMPINISNGRVCVTGLVYNNRVGSAPTPFLLDTGCSTGMVLFRKFRRDNPRVTFPGGVERQMNGLGGSLIVQDVPCSELQLGNVALQNPFVQLLEQDPGGYSSFTGVIGNQIWKRFSVTIDYPGQRLFLKDNGMNDGTVRYLRSGN